jgi:murein DD-endopeptidase MepM/ murein hydrolase activator NlpD
MHKPLNQIIDRGNDPTGFGHFGAKRGFRNGKPRYHKGHDVVSVPGEEVYSMIEGEVTKIGYMYKNALQFRYVEVTNETYRIRLCYVEKASFLKVGIQVCEGDRVAFAQDIAKHHNRNKKKGQALMINHIHVEIYNKGKLIDPNIYLKETK